MYNDRTLIVANASSYLGIVCPTTDIKLRWIMRHHFLPLYKSEATGSGIWAVSLFHAGAAQHSCSPLYA